MAQAQAALFRSFSHTEEMLVLRDWLVPTHHHFTPRGGFMLEVWGNRMGAGKMPGVFFYRSFASLFLGTWFRGENIIGKIIIKQSRYLHSIVPCILWCMSFLKVQLVFFTFSSWGRFIVRIFGRSSSALFSLPGIRVSRMSIYIHEMTRKSVMLLDCQGFGSVHLNELDDCSTEVFRFLFLFAAFFLSFFEGRKLGSRAVLGCFLFFVATALYTSFLFWYFAWRDCIDVTLVVSFLVLFTWTRSVLSRAEFGLQMRMMNSGVEAVCVYFFGFKESALTCCMFEFRILEILYGLSFIRLASWYPGGLVREAVCIVINFFSAREYALTWCTLDIGIGYLSSLFMISCGRILMLP